MADELGLITLNGLQFDTDPEVYESYLWAPRGASFRTLGGRKRTQERGSFAVDLELELRSGPRQFMRSDMVRAIDQLFRAGGDYVLEDWLLNEITVYFPPGQPAAFHPTHAQVGDWWTYTMKLNVRSIAVWLGAPYDGE